MTTFDPLGGDWSEPKPLTADDGGGEIGSGHVADATGQDLAYVFIGKPLGEQYRFQAKWRWFKDGGMVRSTVLSQMGVQMRGIPM